MTKKKKKKKNAHYKFVDKVNNVDTIEIVKKLDHNVKITEIKSKIPSISGLATSSPLTAVENKIPLVSNLFKKTITQKLNEIEKKVIDNDHNKYFTTSEFYKLTL